jgi:hypothetical protein
MPIFMILALMWVAVVSGCTSHDAQAMTTVEAHKDYGDRLDLSARDQIKAYLCKEIDCPDHFTVDELKTSGRQFSAIHVSAHYVF